MKLHFPKILLFFFPLNILLTSYHVYSKNKPSITPHHTPITTSRVLSESDPYMLNYDNDDDMKSVKENFERQTSQRFEEYEERVKDKRQKCKEQRDKDIQKIIVKDKMEKNLAEKVEKGCLKCGCGLGSVAAGIGIIGGIAISELKKAAMATAIASAKEAGAAEGAAKGAAAFKSAVIEGLTQEFGVSILGVQRLESFIDVENYMKVSVISKKVYSHYSTTCIPSGSVPLPSVSDPICTLVSKKLPHASQGSTYNSIEVAVKPIVSQAETVAAAAEQQATKDAIKASTLAVDSKYAICQNAIIASVVAIIIIALVMIIIYLVLRYRRKKKMNKKQQYTKLLNQ
ncbi:hypothetical protein PFMALIP_00912 [Plasmodium falciparum MaliPS096_E11]|uniref:Surface antigen n=1 Tax=Plasmodium falciparum MaliPS096_E11 TaxID=1036727 RepID=A0A024WUR0_PLAFA|nr:hypothetical protein PFMALIP_00912 [Plasmodium falciparum MaliPS096_E11]